MVLILIHLDYLVVRYKENKFEQEGNHIKTITAS